MYCDLCFHGDSWLVIPIEIEGKAAEISKETTLLVGAKVFRFP